MNGEIEDDYLDGCELDFTGDPLLDSESDLYVLFAEALDPNTTQTVEGAQADWEVVFG
jgi:hypothetical protein